MKIALVVPGGVDRSGEIRVIPAILALIRKLSSAHEVHVFALRQEPLQGSWSLAGASIHNVGTRATVWRTFTMIRAEHRRGAFDVLHSIWSGKCGLLAVSCAKLLRVPSLVHIAGGELVCIPEISYGGQCGCLSRMREVAVLRATRAVTAASAPILEMLKKLGIAAQRVPLGVDLDLWPPLDPQRRSLADPIRLIHVASLNRVKDQSTLLRAIAIVAQRGHAFHLDVIGEDTLDGAIQSLSAALGLSSRVHFHGFLRQTELRPLMGAAHLLLVSSRHEAGPVAMLEAAVMGVPTVGTRVGHLAEWSPEAAIAVTIGDAEGLAQAIIDLSCDEDQRLKLATEAQMRAVHDDADFCARQFSALYKTVSDLGPPSAR